MRRKILYFWIILFMLGILCGVAPAQDKDISSNIYRDKNGYFVLVLPANWKQKGYPEKVRSKVEFQHPTSVGVHIRIIAGPTDDSFEGMFKNIKTAGIDSLKRMFPTANIMIEKNKIGTHNAVKIHTSAEGIMEQEMWQFIAAGIKYNVVFGTNNKTQFAANHNIFENLLGSFVVQEKLGKEITENDIKRAMTANKKRLAELAEKINQLDVALQYVKEGLEVCPDDESLKVFQQSLIRKKAERR